MGKIRKTRPRVRKRRRTVFARWFARQELTAADLMDQLEVSSSTAYALVDGSLRAGPDLRIRIEDLTAGAVTFRDW